MLGFGFDWRTRWKACLDTIVRAIEQGAPVDLVFQSIAGSDAANRGFGVDLAILREAQDAALSLRRGTIYDNVIVLRAQLPQWSIAPDIVAHQGRVALGDDIGAWMLGVLIGERSGLSAFDSLGAYITWQPVPDRMDSERNCVSNIRPPHGLSHQTGAGKIA